LTILATKNLSFHYEPDRPVLAGLSFETMSGRVLGLSGANGCGKSTLINILAGLLEPTAGEVVLDGQSGQAAGDVLRASSALLPQNVDHWLLGETGSEDLYLGVDRDDFECRELIADLIQRWRLEELLDRPVEILSLGQKKRLTLAAALARRPLAVFLDEPLAGLDWPGVQTMLADLARLKEAGVITVIVTHEPALAAPLVDDWLLLKPGGEYLFGPDITPRFEEFGVRPLSL
jgi:ABC-type multidrug transport system ATPase subunit